MVEKKHEPGDLMGLLTQDKTLADNLGYKSNSDWFYQNIKEIKQEHGGQTILVLNHQIIFSGEDAEEARTALRGLGDQMNQCYVRYVPRVEEMPII